MSRIRFLLLISLLVVSGCSVSVPTLTPAVSPSPRPTVIPAATVGPLTSITLDPPGLTLMIPSNWKVPQPLADGSIVISPDGSTSTAPNAGPFVFIIPDAVKIFTERLNSATTLDDPTKQLNKLIEALNRDGPQFPASGAYTEAKYPAAISFGYEHANELTIMLMNAGNGHWIYVGTQAPEIYYSYYNDHVFKPVINSITLKSP